MNTRICDNCGHDIDAHWDRYGCHVEGPDVWVSGVECDGLVASGPCGCVEFVDGGEDDSTSDVAVPSA